MIFFVPARTSALEKAESVCRRKGIPFIEFVSELYCKAAAKAPARADTAGRRDKRQGCQPSRSCYELYLKKGQKAP